MKKTCLLLLMTIAVSANVAFSANSHEVVVTYLDSTAVVDVAADIKPYLKVVVNGAHVSVEQNAACSVEIIYRLSGHTGNGSFVHSGEYKITLSLEGLNLTSCTGAAIQIKNGKRIAVLLKDGTENILADQVGGEQKACFQVKGHAEFEGGGTLTVNGRAKHAYKGNEYVLLKPSTGTINLNSTVKDGLHIDDYFEMKGGSLNILTTGSGYWDDEEKKTKAPSCINTVSNVIISGGVLNLCSTGDGGKGISCDSCFKMTNGTLNAKTSGERYISDRYQGDSENADLIPDSLKNSPKAIKAETGIFIKGGKLDVTTSQDGGEGLESKDSLTICGGDIHIETYDDCINAADDIRISDGNIFLSSLDNDGIDTNQSMYITGGSIVTQGNYLHELGIDVNDKSPYKKLYLTGGTVICVGGTSQVTYPYPCDGAQPALYYKGEIKTGTLLSLCSIADDKEVMRFLLDRDYGSEAGGTAPKLCLMLSSPMIQMGKGYVLKDITNGITLASVQQLESLYYVMDEKENIFENKSFKLGNTVLPYREAQICHNEYYKPILVLYLHGGSSRGDDNTTQLNEVAVEVIYKYLSSKHISATMVVPQCPAGGGWTGQLRKVLNVLLNNYADNGLADPGRIYIMGGSMGGTGTWAQLSNYPDFYAAAMPVAGNPKGFNPANVATTPVYTVMGTADNIMNISSVEEFTSEVIGEGGIVRYDVEQGWTHQNTCERSYTNERLKWLFSYKRGDTVGIMGDANQDGLVNVIDVTSVISHILGDKQNVFNESNVDMNGDRIINILDVMDIINIILEK